MQDVLGTNWKNWKSQYNHRIMMYLGLWRPGGIVHMTGVLPWMGITCSASIGRGKKEEVFPVYKGNVCIFRGAVQNVK